MRYANRIYTEQQDIDRLQRRIEQLPNGAHVALQLEDGQQVCGIVSARPTVNVFFDAEGNEGLNAVVRIAEPALEVPERAAWHDVWLDSITEVRPMHDATEPHRVYPGPGPNHAGSGPA